MIRGNEAIVHVMLANDQEATGALSEQLALCRDLSLERTVEEGLLCAAAIVAHHGARDDAGLLAGAATFRIDNQRRHVAEDLVFRRLHDQLLGPVRETDPDTWDAAVRAGATLSDHDAIGIALRALEARAQPSTVTASNGHGAH